MVLAEQPLCAQCEREGIVTAAREVDHVNGDANDNTRGNLEGLCTPCHSRKTAREVNAREARRRDPGGGSRL